MIKVRIAESVSSVVNVRINGAFNCLSFLRYEMVVRR